MFSQSSIFSNTIVSNAVKIPTGTNLTQPNRTLESADGYLALNQTDNKLYIGSQGTWEAVSQGGDVVGPLSTPDNRIVRFDGASGKLIQSSAIELDDAGNLNGVGQINGKVLPTEFGNVTGPASATDNALVRFDTTTGKLIQNSVVTLDDIGNLNGLGFLNGFPIASGTNTGDVSIGNFNASGNSNGANLSGQVLTLHGATITEPGAVTTGAQSFGGQKDFSNGGITVGAPIAGTTNLLIGNAGYYRTSTPIQSVWDPNLLLFATPTPATINCERIGNMIFIKLPYLRKSPSGVAFLALGPGTIPVPFRPAVQRGSFCVAIIGNQFYIEPFNTGPAYAILYPDGSMFIGPSTTINAAPEIPIGVNNDGTTLQAFTGPQACGILAQTLMFEADA